jgi:transcriptional regulator with XRE-family HTH domain
MAAKKKAAKKTAHAAAPFIVKRGAEARAALEGAVDAKAFLEGLDGPLTFGRHLRAIRLGEELSLEAFAKQLGVSRMHLSDVELGRRAVSVARAAEWARVLGYDEELFVGLALQAELDEAGLALDVSVRVRKTAPTSTHRGSRARSAPAHAS